MFSIINKLLGRFFRETTSDTNENIDRNQHTENNQHTQINPTCKKSQKLDAIFENIPEEKVETTKNLRSIYESILKTIILTGECLNEKAIIDVLTGVRSAVVIERRLNMNPYFNSLRNQKRDQLETLVQRLIRDDFIKKNQSNGILVVTVKGSLFVEGKDTSIKVDLTEVYQSRKKLNTNTSESRSKIGFDTSADQSTETRPKPVKYDYGSDDLKDVIEKLHKNGYDHAFDLWTKVEENQLIEEVRRGLSIKRIAKNHKRTKNAIRERMALIKVER